MAGLSPGEERGLATACGVEGAALIAQAVANQGEAGVVPSFNGTVQVGTNTTDITNVVGLLREQASNAVTAHAGGTQAAAVALTGNVNRLSTVATAGDSAKLPAAAAGLAVFVINDGAASAQIFGAGTDTINSIATATGVPLPAGAVGVFVATATGNWSASLFGSSGVKNTAITTVGAGTLTAAAIVGKTITRSGSVAAYSDATDTAVAIVAAIPLVKAGMSFEFLIQNSVAFPETITAGSGVTLTGNVIIPPLSVGRFLLTVTSVSAVAIVGLGNYPICNLPATKFTTIATDTTIAGSAGDITGANHVYYRTTAAGAGGITYTTRTAAQLFGDIPNAQVGMTFLLTLVSEGGGTLTIADGGQVTITGTATVATKTTRTFVCTFTTNAALTIQSVNKGTIE